jgi:ABC-2 type transport system permease protein
LTNILLGVGVCLLVYVMHFFLDLVIAFSAFWFEQVWSLYHLKSILVTVFGGLIFPLALVPSAWQPIFNFVPLRYIYNFPISVFQGRLTGQEITTGVITIIVWAVFFWLVSQLLWHQGLKRFSAHGG